MQTRHIDVNGLDTEVIEAGAGGRPLMLVHGFTGAKEDFADHADPLADRGWHVVAPDLRGHGASGHPEGEAAYSFAIFTADVVGLADALGWDRFTLLGHSMGGMIVQHVATNHGDRLDALVLMDTSHAAPDGISVDELELGKQVVRDGGMKVLVEVQRDRAGALDTPSGARVKETRPGYAEWGEQKALDSSPDMWLSMIHAIVHEPSRLPGLASVSVPTLVIVGDEDTAFIPQSREMAASMANAELAVIPDAGHSPQFENPEPWFAALTGFLDRVAAGAVTRG